MKQKPIRPYLSLLGIFSLLAATTAPAQTVWDAGGGADTSINLNTNWNNDLLPANDGTAQVAFANAGSVATFNVDYFFNRITLQRAAAFALDSSGGNLTLRSQNSSSNDSIVLSSAATATQTINAPIFVSTNNADSNKLLVIRNNNGVDGRILDINGDIARSADSSTDFQIRYRSVAGSVTRLDGAISNVTAISQTSAAWDGTLLISGNRSLSSTNITAATTGSGVGSISGNLVLGETNADIQSWGTVTMNNGLKVVVGGDVTIAGLTGNVGGSFVGTTQASGSSRLTLSSGSATTIGSNIALGGAGSGENNLALVKSGTGDLTINRANNTFTGGTTITNGNLELGANGALGTGPLTFDTTNTARVRLNGTSQTITGLNLSGSFASVIENQGGGSGVLTVQIAENQTSSSTSNLFLRDQSGGSGTLALVKTGEGTLDLSNYSTINYSGGLTVNAGSLIYTNVVALGTGTVDLGGGTLSYAGASLTTGKNITLTSATTSTLANSAASPVTYSGVITGAGSLVKSGDGIMTLSGSNDYTGTTTVSAGTLLVSGSTAASSAVSVASGATIGGNGTIGGDLSFATGSFFEIVDLNTALVVGGTVSFGAGFGIASLSGLNWDSLDLNSPYTLISTSQTFTAGDIGNFGIGNAANVGTGRQAYFQDGSLQLVVIPEPSTWALLVALLTALVVCSRRRGRSSVLID